MDLRLDTGIFTLTQGSLVARDPDRIVVSCGEGAFFRLEHRDTTGWVQGVKWQEIGYLVADVTGFQDWSPVFQFEFWEADNETETPSLTVRMSLPPNARTRLALPIEALDSQHIFLPRTPGKLRSFVEGKPADPSRIHRFALSVRAGFEAQQLEIRDVRLTDAEPEYPLADVQLVDPFGQLRTRDWPGKTHGMEALAACLRNAAGQTAEYPAHWSRYGGWRNKRLEAKGFFSLQHDGRRWWLVDPEGCAFFSAGMDCVRPGDIGPVSSIRSLFEWVPPQAGEFAQAWEDSWWRDRFDDRQFNFAKANLIRVFGAAWWERWMSMTRSHLVRWGFNTIGAFSSPDFLREARMPYVLPLSDFPTTARTVFRDFPDVFSQEYHGNAARYAEQMRAYASDECLIGYFLRNEPEWAFAEHLEIAEELLDTEGPLETKERLIAFLPERYHGDVAAFNCAWQTDLPDFGGLRVRMRKAAARSAAAAKDLNDFSRIMIEEYVKVPSQAVRKVDPHHLNLGMRYAFILYENQLAGKEHFDVFSINCYKTDPSEVIRKTAALARMPVMIGEFHFGALDRGLQATGIIGVASQEERGKAYQAYVERAASIPACVGVQYFQLNDQAALGRPDGENYQIGFVDVCHKPYGALVEKAMEAHGRMYEIADGTLAATEVLPVRIISNIAS